MIGIVINVASAYNLSSRTDYTGHFVLLGAVLLSLIPLHIVSRKTNGQAAS